MDHNNLEELEEVLSIVDEPLFKEYEKLVDSLASSVYNSINESLCVECGIYTNHDKEHFDRVVRQAGFLLKSDKILELVYQENNYNKMDIDQKQKFFFLNSLELFILLCSIRVHDIALIIDRKNHAMNILYVTNLLNINIRKVTKNVIAEIAQAHTGKTIGGSKNTISSLLKKTSTGSKMIRPQILAAIVRFADELEEGEHRTCETKIITGKVKEENIVFHKYSLSLYGLSIDHSDSSINLEFGINDDETKIYTKPDGTSNTLLEEIYLRIQKLEAERKYFHRFMCNSLNIEKINCKIEFTDNVGNRINTVSLSTSEDYPRIEDLGLEELKSIIDERNSTHE